MQDTGTAGRINIYSGNLAAVNSYTVSLQNTLTISSNGSSGSTSFSPTDSSDKVEFTIVIADPCKTATVNTITVSGTDSSSPYSKAVTDGSSTTVTFVRPTTSVETSSGISSVCGDTSYTLHSDTSGNTYSYTSTWAVISGPVSDTYTLTIDTTADSSLIANESSVTISLYIKATLDDYTSDNRESYTQVNIVINEVTCDCSAMAWDDPTSGVTVSSVILAGTGSSTQTLAVPGSNTDARTSNTAFDKCFIDSDSSNDCATTGAFDSLTWDDGTGATTLPSWITFTSSGSTTQTVSITPTDGTVKGTHNLIAVFNPTNGSDKTFTALTFTVGCEITSFAVSGEPGSNPTYDVFTQRSIINLTGITYTQSPACGYTFTNSFAHTIPSGTAASIIFAGTNVIPSFEIYSSDGTHEAAYTVSLANTITVTSGQGQGSTTSFSPTASSITIDVSNPCKTTTITGITFDPTTITVSDGSTATAEFDIPGDGVDTANLLTGLCGTKVYAIADNSDGTAISNWAVIGDSTNNNGKKMITIDPSQYGSHISSDVTVTVRVTTTYETWTSNAGTQSTIAVTL